MDEPALAYEAWLDVGGTFTDCLLFRSASNEVRATKVLSRPSAGESEAVAPLRGLRELLELEGHQPIPAGDIRLATTIGTNALLERNGSPCALVTNRGFGDLLRLGDQTRPDLFALQIEKTPPLARQTLEVGGRMAADGTVVEPLQIERGALEQARAAGCRTLAVALLHACRNPVFELELAEQARALGFEYVALSHEVAPGPELLARAQTAVVDAYLTPVLRDYLQSLQASLPKSRLRVMHSGGGLVDSDQFRGRDALLSGPAAGAMATAHLAETNALGPSIGFDMGGTSTDVCRADGSVDRVHQLQVADARIEVDALGIHTIAAGGGSVCRYIDGRLQVGPQSAGADPGPLCYGRSDATQVTLTDASLLLGRLLTHDFPFPLAVSPVRTAIHQISNAVSKSGTESSAESVAEGFLEVAAESMAAAIRRVTLERGHDPRQHTLVVFGGAGGQYACRVARRLGIKRMLLHPFASVLSALGVGLAPQRWRDELAVGPTAMNQSAHELCLRNLQTLEARAPGAFRAARAPGAGHKALRREVDLRYPNHEAIITLNWSSLPELYEAFAAEHERRFGYALQGEAIETVRVRLVAEIRREVDVPPRLALGDRQIELPPQQRCYVEQAWRDVPVLDIDSLTEDQRVPGPALLAQAGATVMVEQGFAARRLSSGQVLLEALEARHAPLDVHASEKHTPPDATALELFAGRVMSIAEEMGIVLQRTARSANIRERRDFSCAVFDREGHLLANAPHIPVHLGSMGETVQDLLRSDQALRAGDVFATNAPEAGGTHLPDITVVTPIHDTDGTLRFLVASRGHHADIGGTTPGSMPANAARLEEEGVVIPWLRVVSEGTQDLAPLRRTLGAAPYPARDIAQNLADIRAQVAANRRGKQLLSSWLEEVGAGHLEIYARHLKNNAADVVRATLESWQDGVYTFDDALDDGTEIRVSIRIEGGTAAIDFTGTSTATDTNSNAPRAITVAAVLYVLRTLVARPIPLNAGCLRPVTLTIEAGSLLDPPPGRAVAAGNVETSQRVVDVLLGALACVGASQGTMNNITFGSGTAFAPSETSKNTGDMLPARRFSHYETIAGGAGAGPGFSGAWGVHTHMTNSRITDPEVMETRFPVRILRFARRAGSGGRGRFSGGDGVIREYEFLEDADLSVISERRTRQPYGLAGGQPGQSGANWLNGTLMPGRFTAHVRAGSRLRIETPGGGGYGKPTASEPAP